MAQNLILEKSFQFAVAVVKYCDELKKEKQFEIAGQLIRSGTAVGANVYEAQHAESRADFIHKMKIALKEANETKFWLMLTERIKALESLKWLMEEVESVIKIISKIIVSSRNGSVKN